MDKSHEVNAFCNGIVVGINLVFYIRTNAYKVYY